VTNNNKSPSINSKEELAKVLAIELGTLEKVSKEKHYRKGKIVTNEKVREIYIADETLKKIQQNIDSKILNKIVFPPEIVGGVKGRSRSDYALPHVKKANIAHFDIKDFFPSTTPQKVFRGFRSIGIEKEASKLLTSLVTANNHLPIGFTTSPKISGLVLIKLNRRIKGYLDTKGAVHSIWIDDITVSGNIDLRRLKSSIKNFVQKEKYQLNLKPGKIFFAYNRQPQITAGVNVNNDISAEKKKVESIKQTIFICGKIGIEKYIKQYEPGLSKNNFVNKMSGRLGNLISINKIKYKKLQEKWRLVLKNSRSD